MVKLKNISENIIVILCREQTKLLIFTTKWFLQFICVFVQKVVCLKTSAHSQIIVSTCSMFICTFVMEILLTTVFCSWFLNIIRPLCLLRELFTCSMLCQNSLKKRKIKKKIIKQKSKHSSFALERSESYMYAE